MLSKILKVQLVVLFRCNKRCLIKKILKPQDTHKNIIAETLCLNFLKNDNLIVPTCNVRHKTREKFIQPVIFKCNYKYFVNEIFLKRLFLRYFCK